MSDARPDPDALLARVQREELSRHRGKLRIFFGASAGVGKTYAMLANARAEKAEGTDVVVGVVETHGRRETAALIDGLEALPAREVSHKGSVLREFDIDAALARKPALLLVDELAHTNAPGSRHPKRWQDVEELLAAGIAVHTTLNVQHLESLNDVVGQITGVRVFETLPDSVFDRADEVELVDLTPDELLERMAEGKVYLPEQAKRAVENFFRKGNLIALREMALRRTADRVDDQMRDYRDAKGIRESWPVNERLVVAVGPNIDAEHIVRSARRLAADLQAEWTALYVETPALLRLPERERDRILQVLRLAESLGAKSVVTGGGDISAEVLGFAHAQNATHIVIGRPRASRLLRWLGISTADRIVAGANDIDVVLVGTEAKPGTLASNTSLTRAVGTPGVHKPPKNRLPGYLIGLAAPAVVTAIGALMHPLFELANVAMVYLLGVVAVSLSQGRGPSILAALASVLAFDFFFVPPILDFAVSDTQYVVTFAVMLVVGLTISTLVARVRLQARIAGYREERITALYKMSRELAGAEHLDEIVGIALRHVSQVFASRTAILLPDAGLRLQPYKAEDSHLASVDIAIAQWVFDSAKEAGLGTDTLAGTDTHFVPLTVGGRAVGVLALLPENPRRVFVPEQRRLLITFAGQVAGAIERSRVAEAGRAAALAAETESLRNALLAAISHELRTPLATIVGASSALAESGDSLTPESRRELAMTVAQEAQRMGEVVAKILDLARLQAGATRVNAEWHSLEEIVGAALAHVPSAGHEIATKLAPDLPLLHLDAVLMEQVIANLVENAVKYTPRGSWIEVAAAATAEGVAITVTDNGPGIPANEEELIFEKFHRGAPKSAPGGAGLGLALCRAIVEAHGGRIMAANRSEGGALFRIELPQTQAPPIIEEESFAAAKAEAGTT